MKIFNGIFSNEGVEQYSQVKVDKKTSESQLFWGIELFIFI